MGNRVRKLTLGIIKVDLRDSGLDECPDAPVESWHSAVAVDLPLHEIQR